MNNTDTSLICKALGDNNRLMILEMLSGGEKCACKLLERFNITQPTLSHHMKILCDCGLVKVRKDGKWSHYSLDTQTLKALSDYFASLSARNKHECDKCL